jgi:hypothetical protein
MQSLKIRSKVFENRMLRRISEPKRDEMVGCWGKLHDEEFHNLYSSPSIIRMIQSRRMRWLRHVARMPRRGVGGKARRKKTTGKT